MNFSFSSFISAAEEIIGAAEIAVTSGFGGQQDVQHVTNAFNLVSRLAALHNAVQAQQAAQSQPVPVSPVLTATMPATPPPIIAATAGGGSAPATTAGAPKTS